MQALLSDPGAPAGVRFKQQIGDNLRVMVPDTQDDIQDRNTMLAAGQK